MLTPRTGTSTTLETLHRSPPCPPVLEELSTLPSGLLRPVWLRMPLRLVDRGPKLGSFHLPLLLPQPGLAVAMPLLKLYSHLNAIGVLDRRSICLDHVTADFPITETDEEK